MRKTANIIVQSKVSEGMGMSRVRTYGISTEVMMKLSKFMYSNLFTKMIENGHKSDGSDIMLEVLKCYPEEVSGIIIATASFCIGNFDRIEKIERWAEVDEEGRINNETLEDFKPEMIV